MSDDVTRADVTPEVLDRLEALLSEATPTPWTWREEHGRDFTDEGWSYIAIESGGQEVAATAYPGDREEGEAQEDAALIAEAVNTLPALIAAARQVRAAEEAQRVAEERITRLALSSNLSIGEATALVREVEGWDECQKRAERAEAALADSERALAEVRRIIDGSHPMPYDRRDGEALVALLKRIRAALDAGRDQGGERA